VPLLVGLGMPAPVANGTLRVATLVQSATAMATFHRQGVREYAVLGALLVPTLVGVGLGSYTATMLSDSVLRPIFGVALAGWALVLWLRPGAFSGEGTPERKPLRGTIYVLAALIGFYGGFLQVGVGLPLIALLVMGLGVSPVPANAIKAGLVAASSCLSLPVFAMAGQVAWREGLVLSLGSMIGAWIGSRWQLRSGAAVVRIFLTMTVLVSGALMVASAW